ncbi:MAG: iron chelate uptake ABC transporter family permease subunit [Firmicutes bacterium]|jgi:iron complex transport system permease protein|nr:iron chelate uptake ABC transporter family permease subunit [Bacillota bacterium]
MRGRRFFLLVLLLVIAAAVMLAAVGIGAVMIPLREVAGIIWNALRGSISPSPLPAETIILQVRLPRILLGFFIGASLSVAGTAFQGLLQNPLADPYTIGVSSGAALGATAAMLFFPKAASTFTIPLAAFAGALLALFTVYRLGSVGGRLPVVTVLLAGVVVSSFLSAAISLGMLLAREQMRNIFFWLAGGLGQKGWPLLLLIIPYFAAGLAVLLYLSRDLNLILLGEEDALSLGVEVEQTKRWILVAASLITAGAVSVSGMIGFVGLIVPHAMRILIGPDHRYLYPAALLGGGIFLVAADTFARTVIAPAEIPVGIITAFLGAPFFIYLLRRHREKYRF